jgi:hypothetical protein
MISAEQKYNLKKKAIAETKKFAAMVMYVWVMISLFDIHKLIVLRNYHLESDLTSTLGLNLLNAIVLGKIVLIGEILHLAERFKDRALIYTILIRSSAFAVLLVCFEIVEKVVIGMFHRKTLAESIPEMGGGGLEGIALVGVMLFVALIPLFAYTEMRRVLGNAELHSLLFEDRRAGS